MQRLTSFWCHRRDVCGAWALGVLAGVALAGVGGCAGAAVGDPMETRSVESVVIRSESGVKRPPFEFATADQKLLTDVQRGAFLFLWNQCSPETGMVVDRSSVDFISIAGVGFQLAALPIGAERGWVSRDEAQQRAIKILTALEANPKNRKAGLFFHFLEGKDAGPRDQDVVSTVDSAIFFAGALAAGGYFGGDVAERANRLFAAADWSFFVEHDPKPNEPHMRGHISLGWKPASFRDPTGTGKLLKYYWADNGDEHRLVTFLAAAAPRPEHRVDPKLYYQLRRPLGEYKDTGLMCYVPWSGALFTNFFAHCFINYAAMEPDDPKAHGVDRRARIDWWENSRRAITLHRRKAMEQAAVVPNLGADAWGLSACDGPDGYIVPGVYPKAVHFDDERPDEDFAVWTPKDDFGDGTLAPYAAGCGVMFQPEAAVAVLRFYRDLKSSDGRPLVWREPGSGPEAYGFQDSFNVVTSWCSKDCVSIDQGPLILAIENARTGAVWSWFHRASVVGDGMKRLGLEIANPPK